MLEIEYEFREKDLMHYNGLQIKNNETFKSNVKKNRLIYPSLIAVIGLFFWSYQGEAETAIYVLVVALLWCIVVPWALTWEYKQKIMGSYTAEDKKNMYGKYKLTIEPKELVEKSPSGKHKMAWSELLRVDFSQQYIYIVIDLSSALVIPRETVTVGDVDKFRIQAAKMIDMYG